MAMSNENDSKWSPKMLMTSAVFIDLGVLTCLFIMPSFKFVQDIFNLIYLTIVSHFSYMSYYRRKKELNQTINDMIYN